MLGMDRLWAVSGKGVRLLLLIVLLYASVAIALIALRLAIAFARFQLSSRNEIRRRRLLRTLDIIERSYHERRTIVGFFHPYWCIPRIERPHARSNAGGGGERVLWAAIASMQRDDPALIACVYTGDVDASKEEIIAKVKVR